ncbi:MAG TPA: molecular chaperone DnaJ [Thermoplasmata archaeon]|nr:molecular chaperone DnaJ [Thermoplasmata archaeon]
MPKKDYYQVLGLARGASEEDIRRAYRQLARKYHPDVNKDNPKAAEERFKEISEAYEVLADDAKRRKYDAMGHAGVESDFGPGGFTWQNFTHVGDLEDLLGASPFFREWFQGGAVPGGPFGGGATRRDSRIPFRGGDVEISVRIPMSAAVTGTNKVIEVPHTDQCPACRGTGAKDGTAIEKCPECDGRGQIRRQQTRGFTQLISIMECLSCHGTGRRIREICPVCGGSGAERSIRRMEVSIPPGIEDGTVLRLGHQGADSSDGGLSGDLFVQVLVEPMAGFQRDGRDVYSEARVPLQTALLGGETRIPTLTGEALLRIPSGTQPGTQFRLRGEGFPRLRGSDRGDHLVTVGVELPKSLTGRQKELLREAFGDPSPPGAPPRRPGLFGRRNS